MNPSTLREIYDRCDVSNNRTENPMSFEEFEAWVESEKREAVIDELSSLISRMNVGDELLSEPTEHNKGWNKVILNRLSALTQPEGDNQE